MTVFGAYIESEDPIYRRLPRTGVLLAAHARRVAQRGRNYTDGPMSNTRSVECGLLSRLFDSAPDLSDRCAYAEAHGNGPYVEPDQTPRRAFAAWTAGEDDHGTLAGYYRHRRLNEPPCDPCREVGNAETARTRKSRAAS